MTKLLTILFITSVFLLSFMPVKDTDFGWHYRCGKEYLQNKTICHENKFSYFLPDAKFSYSTLLYDISLVFLYDHFGFFGVSLAGAILISSCAFLLLFILDPPIWFTSLAFYLIFFFSGPIFTLGLRSQLVTLLFFISLITILKLSLIKSERLLYLLPLVFLLWVNFHPGFFVGIAILAFFNIHLWYEVLFKKNESYKSFAILNTIMLTVSLIATLFNPFGIDTYRELLGQVTQPYYLFVAEWAKPDFFQTALIILSCATLFYLFFKKKKFDVFEILTLLFFMVLALSAKRNFVFYFAIFFLSLSEYLNKINFFQKNIISKNIERAYIYLISPIILFFIITQVATTINSDLSWKNYCNSFTKAYPCDAIKNYPKLSGNVFSVYEWAGFLNWQKPKIKVFIDARTPPTWTNKLGQIVNLAYINIILAKEGWNELLNQNKTDFIFIGNGNYLDLKLHPEPEKYGWNEVYRDKIAVIYKKV